MKKEWFIVSNNILGAVDASIDAGIPPWLVLDNLGKLSTSCLKLSFTGSSEDREYYTCISRSISFYLRGMSSMYLYSLTKGALYETV